MTGPAIPRRASGPLRLAACLLAGAAALALTRALAGHSPLGWPAALAAGSLAWLGLAAVLLIAKESQ